jgi:hypothetical protein
MKRRVRPRRVYHRGRGWRQRAPADWIKIIGLGAVLLAFVGYILWIYVIKGSAAPAAHMLYMPLIVR